MPVPRTILQRDPMTDLDLVVHGDWPADIEGEVVISTADQRSAAGGHAFYGDGVMIRLALRPGRIGAPPERFAWRPRIIDSPSVRLRARHPDLFQPTAIGTSSPFGISNSSNTAPLRWGERLFATWDAGRPAEVDPVTLAWLGDLGHRDAWAPALDHPVLPLVASSAHPVIDHDRDCLWTVTLNPIDHSVSVIRVDLDDADGPLVSRWPVAGASIPQSMHTVAQTRQWLILADCAFRPDPNEIFGMGPRGITTLAESSMWLVRKEELDETPAGEPVPAVGLEFSPETMHYWAAWDDSDGIRVIFERTNETDLAFWIQPDDLDASGRPVDPRHVGMYCHPMSPGGVAMIELDPASGALRERGVVEDAARYWATQLSTMDFSSEGMTAATRHHQVFSGYKPELTVRRAIDLYAAAGRIDPDGLPSEETAGALVSIDRSSMQVAGEWSFALDEYPCSPAFVPRPGGEPGGHDGWVLVPVLSDDGFRADLFDAADPSRGPVASLQAPAGETVPFLLHALWTPEGRPADPNLRRTRFADDLDARLDVLDAELAASARAVADELQDR